MFYKRHNGMIHFKEKKKEVAGAYSVSDCLPKACPDAKEQAILTSWKWCRVTCTQIQGPLYISINVSVKFLLKAKYKSFFNKGIMFSKVGF